MALPELKSKKFKFSTPKSSNGSYKSSPKRFESIFTTSEGVEILENLDLSKYSKLKGVSINTLISKEITRLEKDLDSIEINMYGATINPDQEFKNYRNYLEKAISIISKKDSKQASFLMRGVIGCEKAFKKITTQIKSDSQKASSLTNYSLKKDTHTQTQIISEKVEEEPMNAISLDFSDLISLPESINKIKFSRISKQLADIYDSLSGINLDIPEATESPEPSSPKIFEFEKDKVINLKLTVIRENISKILQQSEIKKLGINKEIQTDIDIRRNTIIALEDMNQEKEMDLFKLRSKLEIMTKEKNRLEESLVKLSSLYAELERKSGTYEIELSHLRQANKVYEDKIKHYEDKFNFLDMCLEESKDKVYHLKHVMAGLKNILKKRQIQLQEALDQLYNTQIIWRVSEKKLKKIEKAWTKNVGEPFKHADINIDVIQKKYGISRQVISNNDENDLKEIENSLKISRKGSKIISSGSKVLEEGNLGLGLDKSKKNLIGEKENIRQNSYSKLNGIESHDRRASYDPKYLNYSNFDRKSNSSRASSRKSFDSSIEKFEDLDDFIQGSKEAKDTHTKDGTIKNERLQQKVPEKNQKSERNTTKNGQKDESSLKNDKDSGENMKRKSIIDQELTLPKENKKIQSRKNSEIIKKPKKLNQGDFQSKEKKNFNDRKDSKRIENIETHSEIQKLTLTQPKGINLKQKIIKSLNSSTNYEPESISLQNQVIAKNGKKVGTESIRKNKLERQLTKEISNSKYKTEKNNDPQNNDHQLENEEEIKSFEEFTENKGRKSHNLKYLISSIDFNENEASENLQFMLSDMNNLEDPSENFLNSPNSNTLYQKLLNLKSASGENSKVPKRNDEILDTSQDENLEIRRNSKTIAKKPGSSQQRLTYQSSFTEKEDPRLYSHSPSRLIKTLNTEAQEKSLSVENFSRNLKDSETFFISILNNNQKECFSLLKSKEEEFKILKSLNCSKAIQCNLIDASLYTDKLEKLRKKDKYKLLLEKVFDFPHEINYLNPNLRRELEVALKGHKISKCSDDCEHLKRAFLIKYKSKGIPYPIKTIKM